MENLTRASTSEILRENGFIVRQLLHFYNDKSSKGQIVASTTTNEVVQKIIIPETAGNPCCYMQSDYMKSLGGGRPAKKLVSHAWKSKFTNTVLNIIPHILSMGFLLLDRAPPPHQHTSSLLPPLLVRYKIQKDT